MFSAQHRALWAICGVAFLSFSAIWLLYGLHYQETAWDFTQFYLAARLPSGELYNQTAYLGLAHRLFDGTKIGYFPPYVRPAVFALPLKPLAWLSYWNAFLVWSVVQFACYLAALHLLRRIYSYPPEMLLAWALFYPAMFGIITGQDANAVLLLVLVAFLQLRSGRQRLAGILFSLCVYKFNLFLLLPLYLVARRRWRVFWYALGGAAILAGGSFLLQSPRLYLEYLRHIPEMTISSGAAIMPGLRGLTSGWPAVYAVAAAGVAVAAFGAMRRADETLGLAIAITGSLLVAYHVVHYDLALLAIPIAVALAVGGWLARAASLVLLLGVPLWFVSPRYAAAVVVLLFAGLVISVWRRPEPAGPAGCGAGRLAEGEGQRRD